jgi:hypothetical protein
VAGYAVISHSNFEALSVGGVGLYIGSGKTAELGDVNYTNLTNAGSIVYLQGDRGAYSVEDYHATDIEAGVLKRHLPIPTTDNKVAKVATVGGVKVWTEGDAAGSVASDTIWDAKGDLAVGTGSDTAARLPVGANGDLLTPDSTQTTGLKWETPVDISEDAADISGVNFTEQGSDPAAPGTGHWVVYAKSDGIYQIDDAGSARLIGASLTITEQDSSPSVADVNTIKVTNGKLTDEGGGVVSLDISGASTLDGLSDVEAASPAVNDIIAWNGVVWGKNNPNRMIDRAWGSMYQDDTGTVITVGATNTDYIVTGMSAGILGNTTFQNAKELVIALAGVYQVNWSVSFTVASANQEIEGAVGVGGVRKASTSAHSKINTATDTTQFGGTGLLALIVGDLVQIVVRNETATTNISIEHANLSLVFLGLTTGGQALLESGDALLLESGDNLLLEG